MDQEQRVATTDSELISIDSDRDSNKSDSDSETAPIKEQNMFIWNEKYEVANKQQS